MSSIDRSPSTVRQVVSDMPNSFEIPSEGAIVAFAPAGGVGVRNKVEAAGTNNIVPFRTIKPGEQGMPAAPKGEMPGGRWLLDTVSGERTYIPPNATLSRSPDFRQAVLSFYKAVFQQNPDAVIGGINLRDFRNYLARERAAATGGPDEWRKVAAFEQKLVQGLQQPTAPPKPSASRVTAPPGRVASTPASGPVVPPMPTVLPPETTISGPPPMRTEIPLPPLRTSDFSPERRAASELLDRQSEETAKKEAIVASAQRASAAQRNTSTVGGLRAKLQDLNERVASFGMDPSVVEASGLVAELAPKLERIDSLDKGLRALRPGQQLVIGSEILDAGKARTELARLRGEMNDGLTRLEAAVKTLGDTRPEYEQNESGLWLRKGSNPGNRGERSQSSPTPENGGPGGVPPTKPPTGGGGNGNVPDPDEDPEEWNRFIDEFMAQMEGILQNQGVKLSKDGLQKLKDSLTQSRRITEFSKKDFMSRAEGLAGEIKRRHFNLGFDLNTWSTRLTLGGVVASGGLAVISNANPDLFATVVEFMTGRKVGNPPGGSKDISEPSASVENGGTIRSLQNQTNFVVGNAPEPFGDLADPKIYQQNRDALEKWMTDRIRTMVNAAVHNNNSQLTLSTFRDSAAVVDEATRLLRLRLLTGAGIDSNLAQLGFVGAQQSHLTFTGGLILNTYSTALARMREMRADRIGQIVNETNKEVAQVREGLLPTLGGFRVETSGDPAADLVRIDRNISEAQEYEKRLLISQEKIQKALEKLQPYINDLEGSDLEGAPVLKQSLAELQGTLSTVQSQTLTIGNTLLTLGNQRSTLNVALQNLGINERNEVRNQTSRDESAASNQRALGKAAMERWNAASDSVARPISGAPGFRLPFSGRGNLLERLDEAMKPFELTVNDVPASVWLQVLDRIEPNWIYAVMEPTSRPLTPAEVAQRKSEIFGGAGPADPKLVNAVLETMTTNR